LEGRAGGREESNKEKVGLEGRAGGREGSNEEKFGLEVIACRWKGRIK